MNQNDKERKITLDDIHNDLTELLKWIKFTGAKEVKHTLELKLDNDIKKIVYHLSDGKNSTRDIEKITNNISNKSVANYWQEWEISGLGISIMIGGKNRFQHSFALNNFGIKIPEIPKRKLTQEQSSKEIKLNDR